MLQSQQSEFAKAQAPTDRCFQPHACQSLQAGSSHCSGHGEGLAAGPLPQEYLKANFRRSSNLFVREDLSATQGHITSLQKAAGFCQSSRVLSLLSLLTSISDYFGTFAATGRLRSLSVCLRVSSAWLDYHRRKEAVPRMACPPCRRPCP